MQIKNNERTPEYFGAVSRSQHEPESMNPYFQGRPDQPADPRAKRWFTGWLVGQIQKAARYMQPTTAVVNPLK